MKKRLDRVISALHAGQTGQALVLMLIFLLMGSLTLTPILMHMSTALKTETKYEQKSSELFTADAGIETGLWRIKYDYMGPSYDPYDYDTTWTYETDPVNHLTADVTVQNIWMPSNVTLAELGLNADTAKALVASEKLIISGTSGAVPGQPFHVKMDFTPAAGDNLTVKSIGVWLPQGFTYTAGDSEIEKLSAFNPCRPDSVDITTVPGGTSVVWSYNPPYPLFIQFPNYTVEDNVLTNTFSFTYDAPTAEPDKMPLAVTWVTTDMDPTCLNPNDVPIAWDTDMRYYKVNSVTGNTDIETYSSKSQLRNLGNGIAGDYVAIGNSVMLDNYSPYDRRDTLLTESSTDVLDVSPIPDDGDVLYAYLYWSGFRRDHLVSGDNCTSTNFTSSWLNGGDWAYYSSSPYYYFGRHTGGDSRKYLTLKSGVNLSNYPTGTLYEINWTQSVPALSDIFSDSCGNFNNWNNGAAWALNSNYFQAKTAAVDTDPSRLLTMKSGQDLRGYSRVTVSWDQRVSGVASATDGLDFAFSSDNGSTWSAYTEAFRGNIGTNWVNKSYVIPVDFGSQYLTNGFMIKYKVVGFTGSVYCRVDNIKITPAYTNADGLDFAISSDNGTTWSSNMVAFRNNIGSSWAKFSYPLTGQYTTSRNFKVRFYLVGMGGAQQSARIDTIRIVTRPPDNSVTFKINGEQVYFDGSGNPAAGAQPITASYSAVLINKTGLDADYYGYSYASYKDVTDLVQKYPIVEDEEHHTGNYDFTVGDIAGDTGQYLSYAGWSLIIIYGSPNTAGRYIYLTDIHDIFAFNPGSTNLDFDNDGVAGGDVTGFLFPEPIRDKYGTILDPTAAKITCFVGEGDENYSGDSLKITGQQSGLNEYLSNDESPWDNVWNSASPGMSYPGVDVDTFILLWADGIMTPKDTSLHLDMNSSTDAWNLIYLIMSVRSETVTSGTGHYLIDSN